MTYKEAKDVLKNTYIRFSRCNGKVVFLEALKKALEAVDKQIPKKPVISTHKYIDGDTNEEGIFRLKHCPCCWENRELSYFDSLVDINKKYCHRCGQALDWSDTE